MRKLVVGAHYPVGCFSLRNGRQKREKEHSSDSGPSQHRSREDPGKKLMPPPLKLCPSPEFLHKRVRHRLPPRMCVVGPTVHVSNLGLRPEVTYFVLFCLSFLLHLWMRMTPMPWARALSGKLKPSPSCPSFRRVARWPRGRPVLQMGQLGQLPRSSCCASPLFSDNH